LNVNDHGGENPEEVKVMLLNFNKMAIDRDRVGPSP